MRKPDFLTPGGSAGPKRTGDYVLCDPGQAGAKPQDGPVLKQRCLVGQTLVFLGAADERFRNGCNGGMLKGHDKPLQRNLQHFIHGLDKMNRKTREDFLRDVRQVLLIVLRKEYRTQAHSMGGEKFFFDATNGEDFAPLGDFPVMVTSQRTGILVRA